MTAILAIDAATGPCSAAIWHNGRLASYRQQPATVRQSAELLPMIEAVLAESKLTYKELSAVAVTIGPGSFTGIRIALAAARGIGFAATLPVWGFTTMETLAFAARGGEPVLAILNAGKGEVYSQLFAPQGTPIGNIRLGTLETLSLPPSAVVAGNITVEKFTSSAITFPRADALAELAASYPNLAQAPKPFYIRAPDAKLPAKKS